MKSKFFEINNNDSFNDKKIVAFNKDKDFFN